MYRKRICGFFLFFSFTAFLHSTNTTQPLTQVVAPTIISSSFIFPGNCCNFSGGVCFSWIDNETYNLYYCILDSNNTLSTPQKLTSGLPLFDNVWCSGAGNSICFGGVTRLPYLAYAYLLDPSSGAGQSAEGTRIFGYSNVYCCYDSSQNQTVFSWLNENEACYATFNDFSSPQVLTNDNTCNVYCAYGPPLYEQPDFFVFTWVDNDNLGCFEIILNPLTSNSSNIGPAYIPGCTLDPNQRPNNIFACPFTPLFPNIGPAQIAFSWTSNSQEGFFFIYDVITQKFTNQQPQQIPGANPLGNVSPYCCYSGVNNNQLIFTWISASDPYPVYCAVYNLISSSFQGNSTMISETSCSDNFSSPPFSCLNTRGEIVFYWQNASYQEEYAIYSINPSQIAISSKPTITTTNPN